MPEPATAVPLARCAKLNFVTFGFGVALALLLVPGVGEVVTLGAG